jgi:hypothetical protein
MLGVMAECDASAHEDGDANDASARQDEVAPRASACQDEVVRRVATRGDDTNARPACDDERAGSCDDAHRDEVTALTRARQDWRASARLIEVAACASTHQDEVMRAARNMRPRGYNLEGEHCDASTGEEHNDYCQDGARSSAGCQDNYLQQQDLSFEEPSRQNNQPKTLVSPSSLAASLSMLPTPERESYFTMLLSHDKCAQSITKVVKPRQRRISFVTPGFSPSTRPDTPIAAVNPFHFHSQTGAMAMAADIGQLVKICPNST